jgi:hypothetical protein
MVLAWDVLSRAGHPEAAGVEPRLVFPTQRDIQAYESLWPENPFEIDYARRAGRYGDGALSSEGDQGAE